MSSNLCFAPFIFQQLNSVCGYYIIGHLGCGKFHPQGLIKYSDSDSSGQNHETNFPFRVWVYECCLNSCRPTKIQMRTLWNNTSLSSSHSGWSQPTTRTSCWVTWHRRGTTSCVFWLSTTTASPPWRAPSWWAACPSARSESTETVTRYETRSAC